MGAAADNHEEESSPLLLAGVGAAIPADEKPPAGTGSGGHQALRRWGSRRDWRAGRGPCHPAGGLELRDPLLPRPPRQVLQQRPRSVYVPLDLRESDPLCWSCA
ncbi:hypothetical protein C2845_PM13G09330 [Panicum miliaceum]|uniref:Uncharacterized protein n=1 Tax=Panicum miliaceum TaxID=4540 RepID=A0A3L6RM30_PANMI|nr:hypothetical protein C2845_PM13G09330 [Panicum miliaceum]